MPSLATWAPVHASTRDAGTTAAQRKATAPPSCSSPTRPKAGSSSPCFRSARRASPRHAARARPSGRSCGRSARVSGYEARQCALTILPAYRPRSPVIRSSSRPASRSPIHHHRPAGFHHVPHRLTFAHRLPAAMRATPGGKTLIVKRQSGLHPTARPWACPDRRAPIRPRRHRSETEATRPHRCPCRGESPRQPSRPGSRDRGCART